MSRLSYRTLGLVAFAGALGASGCVEADHPAFTVGWDTTFVESHDPVSCQNAGTPTVELTMVNQSSRRRWVNRFSCDAQGGESESLPGGRYDLTIALLGSDGRAVSTQGGTWTLVRDGLTDLGIIHFQIQSFQIAWTLARGNMSLACQDIDAKTVNLITRLNSEPEKTYAWPCPAGSGFTPAILIGTYSVRPQLVSSSGQILWDATEPMTIVVNGSQLAVIQSVNFNVQ